MKIELSPKEVMILTDLSEKGCWHIDCLDCPINYSYCDNESAMELKLVAKFLINTGKEING